jgi:2'-5' RNA ligase
MSDEKHDPNDELASEMDELFETVRFEGDVQPWRDVAETDEDPDDESPATVSLADRVHEGLMVAIPVPTTIATALQVLDGIAPEDMHLTLCYVGRERASVLSPQDLIDLTFAVATVVERTDPFEVRLERLDRFPASDSSDGQDVIHAVVTGDALLELRKKVYAALKKAGSEPKHDFEYTPHITIQYVAPGSQHLLDEIPPMVMPVTSVEMFKVGKIAMIPLGVQNVKDAEALERLRRLPRASERGVECVRTRDIFDHPMFEVKAPLNRKTTMNVLEHVPLASLAPSQALIPAQGLERYITKPRKDPSDIARFESRTGQVRYVIQEGHTRLAAAKLRQPDASIESRVWMFEEDDRGDWKPVERGMHKRAKLNLSADKEDVDDGRWVTNPYEDIVIVERSESGHSLTLDAIARGRARVAAGENIDDVIEDLIAEDLLEKGLVPGVSNA